MAKTGSERHRDYLQDAKEDGLHRLSVVVPDTLRDEFLDMADRARTIHRAGFNPLEHIDFIQTGKRDSRCPH